MEGERGRTSPTLRVASIERDGMAYAETRRDARNPPHSGDAPISKKRMSTRARVRIAYPSRAGKARKPKRDASGGRSPRGMATGHVMAPSPEGSTPTALPTVPRCRTAARLRGVLAPSASVS